MDWHWDQQAAREISVTGPRPADVQADREDQERDIPEWEHKPGK
jgi:hypothetical protein